MISIMKIPALYGYVRVSSAGQTDGNGPERQLEAMQAKAIQWGMPLLPENVFHDDGVSAFTGSNISEGKLGKFIERVKAGEIAAGSTLMVEAHDRLSRQGLVQANLQLFTLLAAGIRVHLLMDDKTLDQTTFDFGTFVMAGMKQSTANEESGKKKDRHLDNWEKMRRKAASGGEKMTAMGPAWLKLSADRKRFEILEPFAKIVRRIFDMYLAGQGIHVITKTLNRDAVPAFKGGTWVVAAVNKILLNKAVFGEFQPHKRVTGSRTKRVPVGDPVADYYPAILSEATFYEAQAIRERHRTRGKGRKGDTLSNLFTDIAQCMECGSKMYFQKSTNKRWDKTYRWLYCKGSHNGTCTTKAWRYEKFEESFLKFVAKIDLPSLIEDGTGSRSDTITNQMNALEGEKQDLEKKISKHLTILEDDDESMPIDTIKAKIRTYNARVNDIKARQEALTLEAREIDSNRRAAMATNVPVKWASDPVELKAQRMKLREHIMGVVESIHMVKPNDVFAARAQKAIEASTYPDEQAFLMHVKKVYEKPSNMEAQYLVRFRGGESQLIFPDRRDATQAWSVTNMGFTDVDRESLPKATKTREEFALERSFQG